MKMIRSPSIIFFSFVLFTTIALNAETLLEKVTKGADRATQKNENEIAALKEFEAGVDSMITGLQPTILPAQIPQFIPHVQKTIEFALDKIACGGQGIDYYNKVRLLVDKSRELLSRPAFQPKSGGFLAKLSDFEKKFKKAMACPPCPKSKHDDKECPAVKDVLPTIKQKLEDFSQQLTDLSKKFEEPIPEINLDDVTPPINPTPTTTPVQSPPVPAA